MHTQQMYNFKTHVYVYNSIIKYACRKMIWNYKFKKKCIIFKWNLNIDINYLFSYYFHGNNKYFI